MAVDERSSQQLAPFMQEGETPLYAGRCYTGFSFLFLVALMFALVGAIVYMILATVKVLEPVRTWRLCLTDRRLILVPENLLGRLKKPGEERTYEYSNLTRSKIGRWLIMGHLWRLWTADGQEVKIQLPRARHNRQRLEEVLQQVAPHLAP